MATSLRELVGKFTVLTNPEAIEKVNALLDTGKHKLHALGDEHTSMEKLAHSFETVKMGLEAFVGYEAIRRVTELAESFAKLGENIKVTALSLGLGVEEYQKLAFAAQMSSVTNEQLSHSMMRLSRALYEARMGSSEAQEVFSRLGVPAGEIQNLHNADQALLILSGRLSQMHDPIEKLALVQKTLGRGSMEMVAFLSQGPGAIQAKMKQAAKDGLVLTEAQVDGLERMNHAFEKMEAKVKVIFASFIEPMSRVVEGMVDDFVKIYEANKAWIGLNIEEFEKKIAWWLGFIDGLVQGLFERFASKGGGKGLLGAILGDVALVGTAAAALAGMATSLKLISGIAETAGIYKLITALGGLGAKGAAAAFGGAAVAENSALGVYGGATTGEALLGAGVGGPIGFLLGSAFGGVALGDYLGKKYEASHAADADKILSPEANMDIIPGMGSNYTIDARSENNFNITGGNSKEIVEEITKRSVEIHKRLWEEQMLTTHSNIRGNKQGSEPSGAASP